MGAHVGQTLSSVNLATSAILSKLLCPAVRKLAAAAFPSAWTAYIQKNQTKAATAA
jgi:hypothetical protein